MVGRVLMVRVVMVRVLMVSMFLMGTGAAMAAHAKVVTYGIGLKTCEMYMAAKLEQSQEELSMLDWLAGYVSGVNSASNHNVFGDSALDGAVYWLDDFCKSHPPTEIAVALDLMVVSARSRTAVRRVELTTYGTGYKPCAEYLSARAEPTRAQIAFIDWLGGYVSGVNAISPSTDDALRATDLTPAVYWLDTYCGANPDAHFADAIEARLAISNPRDR
jgi:hypothetical protein